MRIYFYTRFERFWHWVQALLIIGMLATGFEIHGTYSFLGFEKAVSWHNAFAGAWGILYAFILFWIVVTGEWKQYVPRLKNVTAVIYYYSAGIFMGKEHPAHKTAEEKHNPLQRLIYVSLLSILLPFQIGTGILYYVYTDWAALGIQGMLSLKVISALHAAGAFSLLAFVIVHVYMTTTGPTVFAYLKGMLTGYEDEPVKK